MNDFGCRHCGDGRNGEAQERRCDDFYRLNCCGESGGPVRPVPCSCQPLAERGCCCDPMAIVAVCAIMCLCRR